MSDPCAKCGGTGFVVNEDERGVATAGRCGCRESDRDRRRLDAVRIPPRYEHCTFEHFECHDPSHERALAIARAWVDAFPGVDHGLMFVGEPGRGKTHLAVAVLREVVHSTGCHALFWEQNALLRRLRDTWDAAAEGGGEPSRESSVWREIDEADLLVLDDVGAGRATPWKQQVLGDLISGRYNAMRSLIITTNLRVTDGAGRRGGRGGRGLDEPPTLQDHLGDALISRLNQMCERVVLQGDDYRSGILSHRQA